MPAINFRARYAQLVQSGQKRQTVRKPRADGRDPKPGENLYLYVGMRTKSCRLLLATVCSGRREVQMWSGTLRLDGKYMNEGQREIFAIADGFESWQEFENFFLGTHGLPFHGFVYYWPAASEGTK